jgi:hydrogenase expression/formation protein HypC
MGVPMKVTETQGLAATCVTGERVETVDLSLTGPLEPGTWVLVFLGSARDVLDEETADQITRALEGLRSVMNGGDLGDAFADLEAREPQLPPHLQPTEA